MIDIIHPSTQGAFLSAYPGQFEEFPLLTEQEGRGFWSRERIEVRGAENVCEFLELFPKLLKH